MKYEVIEKSTGSSEVMTDHQIEKKFGPIEFTQMVAEIHSTHKAVGIGSEDDDFLDTIDDMSDVDDIMDAMADFDMGGHFEQ